MRYQVFDSESTEASPRFSAPWKWVAMFYASSFTLSWQRCRVIDKLNGKTLLNWASPWVSPQRRGNGELQACSFLGKRPDDILIPSSIGVPGSEAYMETEMNAPFA